MKGILLVLLLCCSHTWLLAQDKAAARALVKAGVALHDQGDFSGAIAKFDAALAADADNYLALAEKCNSLCFAQRYDECIALCEKTLQSHSDNGEIGVVYLAYANSLDHLKRGEEALAMYHRGQQADPDNHQMWYNEGVALAGMKRTEEAIPAFQKAVRLQPKHASSHNALARLEHARGNRVAAVMAYARFLVLEPEGQRATANLPMLEKALRGDVEQTGKNSVKITVDGSRLPAEGDTTTRENDFSAIELTMSLLSAADFEKKSKGAPHERFLEKFQLLCGMLEPTDPPKAGFYWEYYAPFFHAMKVDGHLETAVMLMYASTEEKAVRKWLDGHEREVKAFYVWCGNHSWPR